MTEHEAHIAAAKASLVTAQALGLPADDPARGIAFDAQQHIERIERALERESNAHAKERHANRAMREAVITFGGRMRIVVWMILALVGSMAALAYYFIDRNRDAIRVSCTLLGNAVIESGGGGTEQIPTSPAAKAQRENTTILVAAIDRELLTSEERATLARNARIVAKAGGVISIPDCNEIARHPDRVLELLLNRTTDPARRSPATRP